jgi:Tol biopolymer transport system component
MRMAGKVSPAISAILTVVQACDVTTACIRPRTGLVPLETPWLAKKSTKNRKPWDRGVVDRCIRIGFKDFRESGQGVRLVPPQPVAAGAPPSIPVVPVTDHRHVRGLRHAGLACTLLFAAACADGTGPVAPAPAEPGPGATLDVVACQADLGAATVLCRPSEGGAAGGPSAVRTLGGQGVNVRLASNGVVYDSAAQVFEMKVTVQNLLAQRMGTADGGSVTGVTVFFYSEPVVSAGTGTVSVRNADGEGMFLDGMQPYFHYPQVLGLNATTPAKTWRFDAPRTVQRFTFLVYVRTELLPVIAFDAIAGGNRDIYRVALDGSDLVRLTTNPSDDRNPTVGGGLVVFGSYRHGKAELYSVPLAGGAETRLTTTAASETDPALSIDGTRLAYASDAALGVSKVWTMPMDGNAAPARATPATFGSSASPEAAPSWGPRNDRVALVGTSAGTADVFDMVLGSAPVMVAGGNSTAEVNPAYSPDGRYVAYATNATGNGDLYMVRVSTGEITRLTSGAEAELHPSWLLDGRLVYVRTLDGGAKELRWMDPAVPGRGGVVPLPAGMVPERPYAAPF